MAKEKRYDLVSKSSRDGFAGYDEAVTPFCATEKTFLISTGLNGKESPPSCKMAQQDPKVHGMQYKGVTFLPKLRKNRKIELRWGNKYYEAIKSAVFTAQHAPYMPADPPQSIKEEIDKTGYVCKQCRDCFRFLSSIEEHTARRSWVLGFWCQQCFVTTCTHKAEGKANCSSCIDIETAKHVYLLGKGIKKNLKKGVTRVFYNQCQFFAHLRMHGINVVDLGELMLMPLPCGIENQHYAQLDKIWKAVMEVMFIRRTHIMDWARDKKISWISLVNSNAKHSDLIADIVSRYSEDCMAAVDKAENSRQDNPIQFEDSRRIARRVGSQGNATQGNCKPSLAAGPARRRTVHVISKLRKAEDKFVPNDIAFVDCGPTANNCIPEAPDLSSPDHSVDFSERESSASGKESPGATKESAPADNPLWQSFSQQYDKLRNKSRDGTLKMVEARTESSSLPSISRTGPRVLTIRSPKSLSLSTIMKHLPSDGMNRKKLVVVAEDSKAANGFAGSSERLGVKRVRAAPVKPGTASLVPIAPKSGVKTKVSAKAKVPSSTNLLTSHKNKPGVASNAASQSFSEQMSLHGKIVFQNGRKYIIRHVPKAKYQSIVKDSLMAKKLRNPAAPPSMPVSVSKRLLLPKPATASSVQKSIVIAQQPKLATILPKIANAPDGLSVMPVKTDSPAQNSKSRITRLHKSLLFRIRESMQSEWQNASKKKLDAYIENLKEINDAYTKAMGFDNDSVITANLRAIERLEKLAVAASTAKIVKEEPDEEDTEDSFEKSARDWESNIDSSEKRNCEICDKTTKPTSYIVGLSGPASDETQYCQCYNNICYLCNTNQGSLLQLKAHIKWHKGEKPFMCPDCSLVFETAKELEVHVWTTCFHPMSRHIFGCCVCDIEGILDMESVAKHFLVLHTRRKTICSECKMEYSEQAPSHEDYKQHVAKHHHHQDTENISEPKRLFLCNLKQCVVRPELFRAHLSDHIGVLRWIYYKCPFCLMVTQRTGRNKTMIREHLIEHHLDRLHEVVSADSLLAVLKGIQYCPNNSASAVQLITASTDELSSVSNANVSGPMIINARTITSETFEHGAEEMSLLDVSTLPKILDVRSEVKDEFETTSDSVDTDFGMQIIAVESMAESPDTKSEISDEVSQESTSDELASLSEDNGATKVYSSPLKDDVDTDSSTSDDDMSMELSPPKLERKPSSLLEPSDENDDQDWNNSETEKTERRPWRIALNSPTSVETPPVAYNCHVCGESINTSWSVIKKHFSSRHAGDYQLSAVSAQIPQISSGYIDGGYRDDCNIRKRKTEAQITPAPKRRRRWGPKKYFEKPGSPSLGLCVKPEPVREVEGSFRCKKCDEPFDEIALMREHIATKHRIKGQYLICLECGENFVVVPSLQMHLKALHGIQDPITYLTKNTAYAPDTPEDMDEEERIAESNQCYVCMAVFEDKAAVDKHIRVHGMAFLKRKRFEAQKAQKCWEKKREPPDNTGNATSHDEKSKGPGFESKAPLSSLEIPNSDSKASKIESIEEGKKNMQKFPMSMIKNVDLPDSSNNSANSDDKSPDVQDSTPATQDNAVDTLGTSETA